MAAPTQVVLKINNGDGTTSNVTITIPPAADQFGIVQTIARVGAWTSDQTAYYPANAILKITPQ